MSSKSADAPGVVDETAATPAAHDGSRAMLGAGALFVVALIALAMHLCVPAKQFGPMTWLEAYSPWVHPYPVVLQIVLAASLVLAMVQTAAPAIGAWVQHYAPLMAGAIVAAAMWDLVTQKLDWMPLPYFPGPNLVLAGMIEDKRLLFDCTWHSLILLLSGYGLGVAAGVASGVLIGWYPRVRYWGMPALKLLGPLPATALIPFVMILSSGSYVPAAALIAFAVWFPVTMLTSSGIASVRLTHLDVARTLGADERYLIFRVAIPSALPNIFIGMFMGLLVSFLTLIVAEAVGVENGLGWYVNWRKGTLEYSKMYAALIVMAVFCSGLMTLLFQLRDRVLSWQKGVIKW